MDTGAIIILSDDDEDDDEKDCVLENSAEIVERKALKISGNNYIQPTHQVQFYYQVMDDHQLVFFFFQTPLHLLFLWMKTWLSPSLAKLRCCLMHAMIVLYILSREFSHPQFVNYSSVHALPFADDQTPSFLSSSGLQIVKLVLLWPLTILFVISAFATSVTSWHRQYVLI